MALDALIFDIDGTLLDTNAAHIEAWRRAFASCGYKVAPDRIAVEIGKGGDLLVSAVLGRQAEEQDGKALRQRSQEEFIHIAGRESFPLFPGVRELLGRLRDRGLKTALATSSKVQHLDAMMRSAGVDLRALVDGVINADDIQTSKPAPDLVLASLAKLGLAATQCAMVGDTPYDAEACKHAGVVCLGVLSGGNSEAVLRRAGARAVWQDTADLLGHLDEALDVASPYPAHLTQAVLEALMREALASAREGMPAGELPIGCVLAHAGGSILARGHSERRRNRNQTAHAAMAAFAWAAGQRAHEARDLVLVCTLEPCVMCTGAALEVGVDTIVYGHQAPPCCGSGRIAPAEVACQPVPRVVGNVLAPENRALLEGFLQTGKDLEQLAYTRRLLGAAEGPAEKRPS